MREGSATGERYEGGGSLHLTKGNTKQAVCFLGARQLSCLCVSSLWNAIPLSRLPCLPPAA